MRHRRQQILLMSVVLACVFLVRVQAQAANQFWTNPGGVLFVAPTPGIGLVADLPWNLHGAVGLTTGGTDANTAPSLILQVQRNWHLKLPWLGDSPTEFAGIRTAGSSAGLVAGIGAPVRLYPDLHVDFALELLAGGGASSGVALAVQAVQDL